MRKIAVGFLIVLALTVPSNGNFSTVQISNNTVLAGGFLLDGSAGFLRNDVDGKLWAR